MKNHKYLIPILVVSSSYHNVHIHNKNLQLCQPTRIFKFAMKCLQKQFFKILPQSKQAMVIRKLLLYHEVFSNREMANPVKYNMSK